MKSKAQAVEALINQLDNGDEVDRCYAAQALGRFRDPRALEPLYRHLQDEDLDVCIDTATALGHMGSEDAVQGLIDALLYHAEPDVKQAAIGGLSHCGGDLAAKTLLRLLDRPEEMQISQTEGWDDWWDIQLQAVKALGDCGVTAAVQPLAALLDSDAGQDIESEILNALIQIGQPGVAALAERVDSAQPRQLRRIAMALVQAKSTDAYQLLSKLLVNSDPDVRIAAAGSVAAGTAPDRLQTLIGLLGDTSTQVQIAALKGLETLQPQLSEGPSDEQLWPLLDSSDNRLCCAALRMLSQRIDLEGSLSDALVERLQRGLSSRQEQEQLLCCELVARATQIDVSEQLLALIEDATTPIQVRRQLIQSIGQRGLCDPATLAVLWNSSQDSSAALRHVSLQSLQVLSNHASMDSAGSLQEPLQEPPQEPPQEPLITPLSLLLSALNGDSVEWPDDSDRGDDAAETGADLEQSEQRIALVSVDDQDNEIKPETRATQPRPSIEQILASVSDAYPDAQDKEVENVIMSSTLASITRGNIEATVGVTQELSSDSVRILGLVDNLPEAYDEFAAVVHTNARNGERMILEKRSEPEQIAADRRILAARVLGDCVQADVVPPLLECLMDDDANVRREAADSLGRLVAQQPTLAGLDCILGPVVTQLRAGNEEMRLSCARTLGALKHRAAIPALLAALDDPDTLVRIQVIRALTAISLGKGNALGVDDHVVLSQVTPDRVTQAILDCQDDAEIGVRKAMIEALLELRRLDLGLLLKLGLEEGGALTQAATQALKALAPEAATRQLIKALDDNDKSTIRRLAMQMLLLIHADEAA